MRSFRSCCFLSKVRLLALLLLACAAQAADLSGRVTFRGRPVADALVRAYRVDPAARGRAATWATRTGSGGDYVLQRLPTGDYLLTVEKDGRRIYQGKVTLAGPPTTKNIEL